ncbi:hypothetical protein SMICM17S_04623 [Streptomyces microflavus]
MPSPTLSPAVGVLLPRDLPTHLILPFARRAEELGFGSVWVVEDLGFRGGVAQAASVLASTSRIRVGIGLLPAGARNVAFAALEIATLAQLFPGRTDVGVGHGMPGWMRSVGQWPRSPLTFLEEYIDSLRALLRGEGPEVRGRYVHLDGVRLEKSALPDVVPDILAGVRGPKSLALQGDHEAARRVGKECEEAARLGQDAEAALSAAHSMSFTYLMMGRPQTAHLVSDHALRLHPGDPADAPSQMRCRVIRLFALSALGRLDEAYEEATRLQRISLRFGEHWGRAYADHQLALIHLLQGRPRHAESHARAMLASKHELHDSLGIALGLDLLAGAIAARGDGVAAARTSGTGHTYWRIIGHPHRGTPELGAIREQWELQARQAAGNTAYERAYRRASADDAERGLAHALESQLPS